MTCVQCETRPAMPSDVRCSECHSANRLMAEYWIGENLPLAQHGPPGHGPLRVDEVAERLAGRKRCSGCRKLRPFGAFARNAAKNDGRQPYCRTCWNARRRKMAVAA